jgi:hypothetical protein
MPAAEGGREPEISRFFGIVVAMFYKDHPRHTSMCTTATSGRSSTSAALLVLEGSLSPRALGLVVERAAQRQHELRANWGRARRHAPLTPIQPLE